VSQSLFINSKLILLILVANKRLDPDHFEVDLEFGADVDYLGRIQTIAVQFWPLWSGVWGGYRLGISSLFTCWGLQRDVVYLGCPIAPSYMSAKGGGGKLRGLSQ
jgi:hypothetical protein